MPPAVVDGEDRVFGEGWVLFRATAQVEGAAAPVGDRFYVAAIFAEADFFIAGGWLGHGSSVSSEQLTVIGKHGDEISCSA